MVTSLLMAVENHYTLFDDFVIVIIIVQLCSGAPNENVVQNHLNIALLNVF